MYEALQIFLLIVHITNTADVMTLHINSLTQIFANPVLTTLLCVLNYKKLD